MNVLVITSCTGKKLTNPSNKLTKEDFLDKSILKRREAELQDYSCNSENMYTGTQHLRLMEGIELLRYRFHKKCVDICILSAGYGLLKEGEPIVPYEVTFNSMSTKELNKWSNYLNINKDVSSVIKDYDLVFFLLGDKYLKALNLPLAIHNNNQKLIFFTSTSSKTMIPAEEPYSIFELTSKDATSFSYGLVGLKGYLMKLLFSEISLEGLDIFDKIYKDTNVLVDILDKYRK